MISLFVKTYHYTFHTGRDAFETKEQAEKLNHADGDGITEVAFWVSPYDVYQRAYKNIQTTIKEPHNTIIIDTFERVQ